MKCSDMPELLVSLLYDELETEKAAAVKNHLKTCPSCRAAYDEIKESSDILSAWEDETPAVQYQFIKEGMSISKKLRNLFGSLTLGKKILYGVPLAASAAMLVLSLINFTATKNGDQIRISFGFKPTPVLPVSNNKAELQRLKQETLLLVADMIQESEYRQNRQINGQLQKFAADIHEQRQKDLQMVGMGLQGLQKVTEGKLSQQNQILDDLIQLTGYTMERK